MEKVLVTGGLGFIGSNFVRHMLESRDDATITNVDCNELHNLNTVKDLEGNPRHRFVKGTTTSQKFCHDIVKGTDVVVNFAAQTHVDRSIANPSPFFRNNVIGTFNLLEAVRRVHVRKFVHISTDEVFGPVDSGDVSEDAPLSPTNPYSATKAAAEVIARGWRSTFQTPIVVLRCTNNFGPYQHPEKFIPKMTIRAMMGMDIPLHGGGKQTRNWVYVRDFCSAIDRAIDKGVPGESYNISTVDEFSIRDVALKLLRELGIDRTILEIEDRPSQDCRYAMSSEKARAHFGWKPEFRFQDAISSTVKWYVRNEWWWRPLATPKVLSPTSWRQRW